MTKEDGRSRSAALLRGFALLSILLVATVVALSIELDRATAPGVSPTPAPATPLPPRLVLEPAQWSDLPGWSADPLDGFADAFTRSCEARAAREAKGTKQADEPPATADEPRPREPFALGNDRWRAVCALAATAPSAESLRATLERELQPWAMRDGAGAERGLITGYYEPLVRGSLRRDAGFTVPLYLRPPELVDVDLGAFRPEYKGKRLAGVIRGNRLVPFADRTEVETGALAHRGLELVWVHDPVDAFYLQIQGSGRIELRDGSHLRVGYAAQNGHPYVAIGRELVKRGAMPIEQVSMQSIRAWLAAHPEEATAVMRANPSYVFFRKLEGEGPIGSDGVVLTPGRSVAVDRDFLGLGLPLFLDGETPSPRAGEPDQPLQRLVVAQDTGGAIDGPLRADLFCGSDEDAAQVAGRLKHPARMWTFLPRAVATP